ncbi:MAG TPA: hypothetical protein VGL61_31400 [Kofleriaceae bacterium]|jgi:hypothetical protein
MVGDVTESAFGCTTVPINDCPSGVTISSPETTTWYREFALPDFAGAPWNVNGAFQITSVHFGCWMSNADASVTISVYDYTGALYGPTLDTLPPPISSVTATIGPSQVFTCTDDVDVPITAAIAAGSAFVVGISAVDTVHDTGSPPCTITFAFRLGANGSGESCGSQSCGSYVDAWCNSGSATVWTTNDAVLAVEGTTN